jgi:hypothetical protein
MARPRTKQSGKFMAKLDFEIGTGGYRSAYGTAIVPIDDDGVAIISLGSTDFGSRGRHPDPWWR